MLFHYGSKIGECGRNRTYSAQRQQVYNLVRLSNSGAHSEIWLRGWESNPRQQAYETRLDTNIHLAIKNGRGDWTRTSFLVLPRHAGRLLLPRHVFKFGGGNGTCTRHTLLARQRRLYGHAPP